MNNSSRTPEGQPNQCPLCGYDVRIEPSQPTGDAPCPHCGHLLFFIRDPADASLAYYSSQNYESQDVPDYIFEMLPLAVGWENRLVPIDQFENTLVVASPHRLTSDTLDKLRFILQCPISNVLVTEGRFTTLWEQFEAECGG